MGQGPSEVPRQRHRMPAAPLGTKDPSKVSHLGPTLELGAGDKVSLQQ